MRRDSYKYPKFQTKKQCPVLGNICSFLLIFPYFDPQQRDLGIIPLRYRFDPRTISFPMHQPSHGHPIVTLAFLTKVKIFSIISLYSRMVMRFSHRSTNYSLSLPTRDLIQGIGAAPDPFSHRMQSLFYPLGDRNGLGKGSFLWHYTTPLPMVQRLFSLLDHTKKDRGQEPSLRFCGICKGRLHLCHPSGGGRGCRSNHVTHLCHDGFFRGSIRVPSHRI